MTANLLFQVIDTMHKACFGLARQRPGVVAGLADRFATRGDDLLMAGPVLVIRIEAQ